MPEIVIIGAGPAGLGAATRLEQLGRWDWILLESDVVPGGLSGSVLDQNGFTWDFGGHVTFSHYSYFDQLLDSVVKEWNFHKRSAWIWRRDRWIPYPFQNNIRYLSQEDQTRCIQGLIHRAHTTPTNFQEWIDAHFGRGIAELFLNPYNNKVWAHPPSDLSTEWVDERVSTVDLQKILENIKSGDQTADWGPNAEFRFPSCGGTGKIWQETAARLPQHRICYQSAVKKIDPEKRMVYTDNGNYPYERLISTMPLDQLLIAMNADLRVESKSWPVHSSVQIVGLGLEGEPPKNIRTFSWMYFPEPGIPFFRATLFSSYAAGNAPPGCWSLMLEISESVKRPFSGDPIDQCIAGALQAGLMAAGQKIVSRYHRKIDYGYPVPYVGRNAFLDRAESLLERYGILSRGRFGSWKYEAGNQDHSFMQGVEAADRIVYGADENTYSHPQLANRKKQTTRSYLTQPYSAKERLFDSIARELSPWRAQGIDRDLFERVKRRAWKGLHIKILGGHPHIYREVPSGDSRNACTAMMLRETAKRYTLPDCEFIIHTTGEPPASNLPMFSFCKHINDKTILFPDFSFYSWLEALLPDIDAVGASLKPEIPWEEKRDKVLCTGSGTHPRIKEWAQMENSRLDVRIGDWTSNRLIPLDELRRWKYLAPLPGKIYSPMLKYLFLMRSLVILSAGDWQEFWHAVIDFDEDCICHDFDDPESMERLHEKLAGMSQEDIKRIAVRGFNKVAQTLTLDTVYGYIAKLISEYAALLRFPVVEKEYRLIIARYNEDVTWSDGHPRTVYNKGGRVDGLNDEEQIMLPNVGRESHTYLTYIIDNYEALPEYVMFCQGMIKDHVDGFRIEDFVNPDYDIAYARLSILKEWNPVSGRLMFPQIWNERLAKDSMRPARLNYLEWFERVLEVPLGDSTVYVPGAIFSVSARCIRKRPKEFYKKLRAYVNDHPNPEEGHYMERSWLYIFANKDMRVLHL
jgi:protoporphyrinogen oxidase